MTCSNCGEENREGAAFCNACGNRLDAPAPGVEERSLPKAGDGRYIARAFLGEGGRKQVFRAVDTRLDREVALSVIGTSGLDETSIERVRREAKAMARLGDHPNIVNIFDVGEDSDTIFLVAELMPGGSVDEQLNREGPLASDRALAIARQLAAALQYVHEQGIVHRDIKPANVWLSRDGTAKLGDFGLAAGSRATRLTMEGMMLGTVAYMAPEQATGGEVDARSDLYSLGALLYEATTGKPPFAGDDAVAIISQQINTAPVAPSWHNPQVPPGLEALILDLLAKSPADRPQDAGEVLDRLASISADPPATGPAPAPDNPLDRLAGGVFVGRESESRQLRAMYDAARRGGGGVALLVGEPGIGKTRMAEELLTYARMNGAQLLVGRCYEGEGAPAYWPWIQVIRSSVHDRSAQTLASQMGSGAGYIAQIVSDVRQVLPDVESPAGSDLESSRFQLFDSITTFLRNASRARPLVVFLDDLHWADKPSLLLLDFLSRQLRDSQVLVVCTYRDIELGRQHPLAQALATIIREPTTRRILLRGLGEADVARYIKLTVGLEPAESLVKAIQTETEGNPFFIIETVRLLASQGGLDGKHSPRSLTIPQGVKEVIGRRLDMLSPECNQMLTLASVLGREFELPVIELVAGKTAEELLEALDEAVAARVVGLAPGGGFRFAHALIRETLYDELSTARRLRLHRAAGEALEKLRDDDADRFVSELAHHFFEASALGEAGKAIAYAQQAGDKAMRQLAFEEAAVQYDRALQALDLTEGGDERLHCGLLVALGQAQISSAEIPAAHKTYRAAFNRARDAGMADMMATAALGLGDILTDVGSVSQELVDTLEEALAANAGEESALRVRMLARLGEAYRFDDATAHREDELAREALAMARRVGDPQATAQALYGRIIALGEGRDAPEQNRLATELIEAATQAGDVERRLLGLRLRIVMHFFLDRMSESRRDLDDYAELAARARLPLYSWYTPMFRSAWAWAEGRLGEADRLLAQAVQEGIAAREPNLRQFTAGAELSLAYELRDGPRLLDLLKILEHPAAFRWLWAPRIFATAACGDSDEARRLLQGVVAANFQQVNTTFGMLWAIQLLAEVCRRLDDQATARLLYDMATPFGNRFSIPGYLNTTAGCGHQALGVLATTLGRFDDARYHLDSALGLHSGAGFGFLEAQTRLAQARLYQRRGAPGDTDACRNVLQEVIEASQAGGFKQTLEFALELQQQLPPDPLDVALDGGGESSDAAGKAPPKETLTILFTDIVNSTRLNVKLGDAGWLKLLAVHDRIIRREVAALGGSVIKSRGDGFMLAFPHHRQALQAAIGAQRAIAEYNALHTAPDADELQIRIGVHTGEALRQDGDYFGRHVALAARIADKAGADEILVSGITRGLVRGSPEFEFGPAQHTPLKGFEEENDDEKFYSLRWGVQ